MANDIVSIFIQPFLRPHTKSRIGKKSDNKWPMTSLIYNIFALETNSLVSGLFQRQLLAFSRIVNNVNVLLVLGMYIHFSEVRFYIFNVFKRYMNTWVLDL